MRYVPLDDRDSGRQYCGKLLQQVRSVSSLLELLNDANNDFIVDTLCVDLCMRRLAARGGWRCVCHTP